MYGGNSTIIPGKYKTVTTTEFIPRQYTDYIPVKRRSLITVPASSIWSYYPKINPSYTIDVSSPFTTTENSPYIQTQPTYTRPSPIYNSITQTSEVINPNIIENGFTTEYTSSPSLLINEDTTYHHPPYYSFIQNIPNYNLDFLRDLNINISDITLTDPLLNN